MGRLNYRPVKRLMDIIGAGLLLIVFALPMIAIAVVIGLTIGRPIFFRHERAGLHGVPFRLVKFRTMSWAVDGSGKLLPDEERLTGVGRFLRAASLDELPELWNIVRGDMSLVGPRPLLTDYLSHYSAEQQKRHEVRPGLTGWAQVSGRNSVSWDDRLQADVEYVKQISLCLDVRILVKTIWIVLSARGISADGHATMPRFDEVMRSRENRRS